MINAQLPCLFEMVWNCWAKNLHGSLHSRCRRNCCSSAASLLQAPT